MSCPICGNETRKEMRPFCSRRCADVDLGRWIKGDYAIPGPELTEDDLPPDSDTRPH